MAHSDGLAQAPEYGPGRGQGDAVPAHQQPPSHPPRSQVRMPVNPPCSLDLSEMHKALCPCCQVVRSRELQQCAAKDAPVLPQACPCAGCLPLLSDAQRASSTGGMLLHRRGLALPCNRLQGNLTLFRQDATCGPALCGKPGMSTRCNCTASQKPPLPAIRECVSLKAQ